MAEENATTEEVATPNPNNPKVMGARIRNLVSGGVPPTPESYTVQSEWQDAPNTAVPHEKGTTLTAAEVKVPDDVVAGIQERENKRRTKYSLPEMTTEEARAQHIGTLVQMGMLRANYAAAPAPEEADDTEGEDTDDEE